MQAPESLLAAHAVQKRFGAMVVLNGIDFFVPRGAAIGVVGPNGAGKTTLMGVLAGALPVSAGRVTFLGDDVSRLDAAERCRLGIARTHQIPRPFGGMTVFENVLTAAMQGGEFVGDDARERSADALDLCGMRRLANRRAETLGLLDRKRLELARALATDPVVLLLDEIGGGLTDGESGELVETIRVLHGRDIAIVWIEHVVHVLLQVATHLVCMDAGRVIAEGEPAKVLADAGVVDAYLGGGR
ncbi:MAG TPA: ABC transporter ATP-binding protein [Caldimonas sp.]